MKTNNLKFAAKDLPPALRPFYENFGTEKDLDVKMMTTLTALTCYCALMPRLRTKYCYDFDNSTLLVNLLCIAPSGKGKSMVRFIVKRLMSRLKLRDEAERERLRIYKDSLKHKDDDKNTRQKHPKPEEEPLVSIRYLQKFTLPVVVKYCHFTYRRYGDWLPFFLYGDEMGSFVENKKSSSEFQSVARTAFSMGELYSRDTLYDGGYNAIVDCMWNSVICGQEPALARYINKEGVVLGDAGRQILAKLDERLGEDAISFKPFTDEQNRAIDDMIDRLMNETYTPEDELMPTHFVEMKWMFKDVKGWCQQVREEIIKTGSRAMDSFYVRASVSAFRLATALFHLWGEEPSRQKHAKRLYYHIAQFTLDGQMRQWGHQYEAELPKCAENATKPLSLFDKMPDRFSRDQLKAMLIKEELGTPARTFIYQWTKKHWICEAEKDVYEKQTLSAPKGHLPLNGEDSDTIGR